MDENAQDPAGCFRRTARLDLQVGIFFSFLTCETLAFLQYLGLDRRSIDRRPVAPVVKLMGVRHVVVGVICGVQRRRLNNKKLDPWRIYTEMENLIMGASETIDCVYDGGVFKPLEKVKLAEGTKLRIKIEPMDISKFYGIFGKASADRLEESEGEVYL